MAKGQKIDELYISLGLDIARLQLDFDTAGKTVSETIARLNSQNYQLRLKTDIDLARLQEAGSELDKIKVRYQAISQQLDIQRKKEEILANVLKNVQKTDSDGSRTRYAETNLLKQQKQVAQLEAEYRKLTAQIKAAGGAGQTMGQRMSAGLAVARGSISKLTSGFNLLSAKIAALLAIGTTGAGLFNITQSAMMAGENTYRLTQRLHTTAAEAGQLNRMFSLTGTSIDSVVPLFAKLDKQIESAGKDGNDTTLALSRFGIVLTNEAGNLLPLNEQLAQLAQGYKNAAAAGQEEAFTAEVLGARGAALIPVLEQYDDLMQIASHVKTTGLLNPAEAHAAYLKWRELEMEAGQLKMALGSALLPVAEDLMPSITEGFQSLIDFIKENKEGIEELADVMGTFAETSVDLIKGVADALADLGINAESVKSTLQDVGTLAKHDGVSTVMNGALVGAGAGAVAGTMVAPGIGTGVGIVGGALVGAFGTYEFATHSQKFQDWREEEEALKKEKQAAKEAEDALKKNSQAQAENARTAHQNAAAIKAAAKANDDLSNSIYALTHNDLDNALHEAEVQAKKFREAGADDNLVNTYVWQKQAKAYEDFQQNVVSKVNEVYRNDLENQLANIDREAAAYKQKGLDEVSAESWAAASKAKIREQFEQEVAAKIDSIWQTSLQNRLDEIEREKQAWIQKGLDEVKATRWAEKEKADAQRNAAFEVLQSQKEEFKAYLSGGERGLADYYKEKHGFSRDDLRMTPAQLEGFQLARKNMLENLLPNFRDPEVVAKEREAMKQNFSVEADGRTYSYDDLFHQMNDFGRQLNQVQATEVQSNSSHTDNRQVHVAVHIENAVTQDSESMRHLADQVADRITPAIETALGGGDNSYSNW